jgi:opacity protein-like surface antigen
MKTVGTFPKLWTNGRAGALLVAVLALGAPAFASAQSQEAAPAGWQFEATPYFWASGLKATTQIGDQPQITMDESFNDLLNKLDMAARGMFEARHDRWGMLFDGMYFKLSDSATATRTGPGPVGATATANANVTLKETIMSGALAYRVLEGRTPVDVLGGARYTKVNVDADIGASLYGPIGIGASTTVARSGNKSWTDPFVGARVAHPIADRWTLTGYADTGGSNKTWQAIAGADYKYSEAVSVKFGYRYLKVEYDNGNVNIDIKQYGPYAAVGIRF